eukprot:GHRR01023200.1.p1 GENE.GHRR01023200.1~~GHRR01023200.1.p1  ORF type:complete len:121 (-),score=21.97 GHRR01023200.1:520-882(-)
MASLFSINVSVWKTIGGLLSATDRHSIALMPHERLGVCQNSADWRKIAAPTKPWLGPTAYLLCSEAARTYMQGTAGRCQPPGVQAHTHWLQPYLTSMQSSTVSTQPSMQPFIPRTTNPHA